MGDFPRKTSDTWSDFGVGVHIMWIQTWSNSLPRPPAMADASLPEGWIRKESRSHQGSFYYFNTLTG